MAITTISKTIISTKLLTAVVATTAFATLIASAIDDEDTAKSTIYASARSITETQEAATTPAPAAGKVITPPEEPVDQVDTSCMRYIQNFTRPIFQKICPWTQFIGGSTTN